MDWENSTQLIMLGYAIAIFIVIAVILIAIWKQGDVPSNPPIKIDCKSVSVPERQLSCKYSIEPQQQIIVLTRPDSDTIHDLDKRVFKMDYCKMHAIPPSQEWAWNEAEEAYNRIKGD